MDPLSKSEEAWRLFEGLDLEKPGLKSNNENSLQGRMSSAVPLQSITAQKTAEYVKRAHYSALFPSWASSMPNISDHAITASSTVSMTCETMEAKIQDTIDDLRKSVDYNGLHVVCDFIKFCDEERKVNPNVKSFELFHRFRPSSRDEAIQTQGTTCVGKAWDIVKRLQAISVEGHVILEYPNDRPDEPPIHAAVAVACNDGILLIESEHEIPIIAIKSNTPWFHPRIQDPRLKLSMEIIEVPGNYKSQTPLIVKRETFTPETGTPKISCSQYLLRPDPDPDQSVMKRWLVSSHTWFYPVSAAATEDREPHSFQVNVAQEKITFNIGSKKFRLPLSALHQTDPADPKTRSFDARQLEADKSLKLTPEELDKYKRILFGSTPNDLGGSFFNAFKSDKSLLIDQLFTIASHHKFLQNLREK